MTGDLLRSSVSTSPGWKTRNRSSAIHRKLQHFLHMQPMCNPCERKREIQRGKTRRPCTMYAWWVLHVWLRKAPVLKLHHTSVRFWVVANKLQNPQNNAKPRRSRFRRFCIQHSTHLTLLRNHRLLIRFKGVEIDCNYHPWKLELRIETAQETFSKVFRAKSLLSTAICGLAWTQVLQELRLFTLVPLPSPHMGL